MSQLLENKFVKNKTLIILAAIVVTFGWHAYAQTYDTNNEVVQTFAGSGFSGDLNGVGQLTMFNGPNAIASDSHSNIFFWDSGNRKIKKITPDGTVTTFAGGASFSGGNLDQGTGTNVYFSVIGSLTIDRNDVLWASGFSSSALLYKITVGAVVTSTNLSSLANSSFGLSGVCADSIGNIYFSIGNGNKIYRYATNKVVTVFAGSGNIGYADGNGIFTAFYNPTALAADTANNIYVWDSGNLLIRKIDQGQNVTTLAGKYRNSSSADGVGTSAGFGSISQMCVDGSGNLILACGNSIRKIYPTTNVV